jgi:hypothetical protein
VTFRTSVEVATISRIDPTVNVAVIDSDETAPDGTPVTVPVELLLGFFLASLGTMALANAAVRARRR